LAYFAEFSVKVLSFYLFLTVRDPQNDVSPLLS